MKNLLFTLGVLLGASLAMAATGTVMKVQGTKAIVQFDQPVKPGDKVQVAGGEASGNDELDSDGLTSSSSGTVGTGTARRKYAFEYSWQTSSITANGSSAMTNAGNVIWFFNKVQYEIAGIATVINTPGSTFFGFGVLGMWDFVKNVPGVTLVPGAYGKVVFNVGSGASNGTTETIGVGGSADWFPFVERVAINISLEYDIITGSGSSSPQQIVLGSGAKIYF